MGVSACLGSPAVTLKGGDVVYAGDFNLGGDDIGPDMTLDPARTMLAAAPDLLAKLQPAAWVNGSTALCAGTYFYAYEIKGAPVAPGYVRGAAPLAKEKEKDATKKAGGR
jgi:hypothetical protein